ncbi:MAG: metal-dependent transcriptional regulator [Phycisphaerae bacterium]|nr:metal-dependent transcriptional regulator [Phycisphaerae bacterium]
MDVWKQFEKNVITHSAAHHLMAIDSLIRCHGYARVSDVARLLEITPGSVSLSLKPLKAGGFVEQDENRFLRLAPPGQRLVDLMRARRSVIVKFLCLLGVDRHQAEIDSCKIEHLLSGETARRLTDFLRFASSPRPAAREFLERFAEFDRSCERDSDGCPCASQECLGGAGDRELDPVS